MIGKAFDMEVLAWSQNLTKERAAQVGVERVTKNELLARSDVVSVHLVSSDRTRGMIQAPDLALMKPTAYLVNVSRGPIVDEQALLKVLGERTIAGAGIDVFSVEPLPLNHPFRQLENAVLTPHVGYMTIEQYRLFYTQVVENIQAFLRGKPIRILDANV